MSEGFDCNPKVRTPLMALKVCRQLWSEMRTNREAYDGYVFTHNLCEAKKNMRGPLGLGHMLNNCPCCEYSIDYHVTGHNIDCDKCPLRDEWGAERVTRHCL